MPQKFGSLKFYNDSRDTISGRYLVAPTAYLTYTIYDVVKHEMVVDGLNFEVDQCVKLNKNVYSCRKG